MLRAGCRHAARRLRADHNSVDIFSTLRNGCAHGAGMLRAGFRHAARRLPACCAQATTLSTFSTRCATDARMMPACCMQGAGMLRTGHGPVDIFGKRAIVSFE